MRGLRTLRLWGFCLLAFVLVGCQVPPPLHNLQLWDGNCEIQTDQRRFAPRLSSLLSPESQIRRAEIAALLYAPVPRNDLLKLALDLHPELRLEAAEGIAARTYMEGDSESFWVGTSNYGSSRQIEARLLRVSDISYAWVEAGVDGWDAYLVDLVTRFDAEVFEPSQWLFGFDNYEGFDQDPRIHLLFVPKLGRVLGYFDSSAGVSKAALPRSSEKDLLFLNLDYMGEEAQDLSVLAHELQHLVHWFQDPSEREFLNEGLSELAPSLLFPGMNDRLVNNIATYADNPDLQLNSWAFGEDISLRHYGAGAAFALYLTETFGPEFLPQIVSEPLPGVAGLNRLLTHRGCEFSFDDLFADFAVANLVQAPAKLGAVGRLGYASLEKELKGPASLPAFKRPYQVESSNSKVTGNLPPYAVHYIQMAGVMQETSLDMLFQGAATVPYATPDFAPPLMWSSRMNSSAVRMERSFDLTELVPGTEVLLEAEMWWDIEEDWDYGYVAASRDGRDWELLEGPIQATENPNGMALGHGLTGLPSGEGIEPEMQKTIWNLSDYAGEMLRLRFDYVTDGAMTSNGWQIASMTIKAIGFQEDFSGELEGWSNEGWVQVQEQLPITWLVQVVRLGKEGTEVLALDRQVAAEDGSLRLTLPALSAEQDTYLLVAQLAPLVTTSAPYEIQFLEHSDS